MNTQAEEDEIDIDLELLDVTMLRRLQRHVNKVQSGDKKTSVSQEAEAKTTHGADFVVSHGADHTELVGVGRPVGVAVDDDGRIYVPHVSPSCVTVHAFEI